VIARSGSISFAIVYDSPKLTIRRISDARSFPN
jgi:hypothetical protein